MHRKGFPCTDREALLALYWSSGGPRWTRQERWAENDPDLSNWHGVTSHSDGRVLELDLFDNGLKGRLLLHQSRAKQNQPRKVFMYNLFFCYSHALPTVRWLYKSTRAPRSRRTATVGSRPRVGYFWCNNVHLVYIYHSGIVFAPCGEFHREC